MTDIDPAPKAQNLTPKAKADLLVKKLLKGQQVHNMFADTMKRQLTVSGQSMEHWENKFKISIPTDNLTPAMCRDLDMRILELNQEATFYHAVASAKAQWLKRGSESAFNDKFWTIVQEFKAKNERVPGQDTLKTLASIGNEEVDSAQTIADIECKFWKDILEHLGTCRRLVENASMTISTELKHLNNT